VDTAAPAAGLEAVQAPVPGAPRSAAFAFAAQDVSPVDFACRLSVAAPPPPGASLFGIGLWLPCSSPQVHPLLVEQECVYRNACKDHFEMQQRLRIALCRSTG
jgi:hypothetical protein